MAKLDIILTHYNEPWHIGKPFFDMLEHQRCVRFQDVCVILVQDGEEHALPWQELLVGYTFRTRIVTIDHQGVAVARNVGFSKGMSEWVMFCDFDDMLADACSLAMLISQFPISNCDLIWCKMVRECMWNTGDVYLNKVDEADFTTVAGKMYRRRFLEEKKIAFMMAAGYFCDTVFNTTAVNETKPFRIMALTTDFYPYLKTFRADSMLHTPDAQKEMVRSFLNRDKLIAYMLKFRHLGFEYRRAVAKTICSEYYAIYDPATQEKRALSPGFLSFYRKHKDVFHKFPSADVDVVLSEAELEKLNLIQNIYNEHKIEMYFRNDDLSFTQWLAKLDGVQDTAQEGAPDPVVTEPDMPSVPDGEVTSTNDQHVVVYCGTYNVYQNMIAACKSLLCNTPVDRVFFLSEDDTFPHELPDIITNISVKGQKYFPPDGPNYNNAWTYMCMIRAAFPEMFPQYSKILSLDIDTVVTEDVSDLWDYDMTDYYLAGVPEPQRQRSSADPMYINFGVVMMNLDKLRQDNIQPKLIDSLNTQKAGCPEQDVFNKFCAGHILELPADYNYTTYSHITGDAQSQRILHYAGQKFWRHYANVKQYADMPWDEVMRKQNELKRTTHEKGVITNEQ